MIWPAYERSRTVAARLQVRHLMTHTAGLPYCFLNTADPKYTVADKLGMAALPERVGILPAGMDDFAAKLAEVPLADQPGSAHRYGIDARVSLTLRLICGYLLRS